MNYTYNGASTGLALGAVVDSSGTVIISEAANWLDGYWKANSYPTAAAENWRMQTITSHNDGVNFGFVDGHAKWSKPSSIKWSQFSMATTGADLTNSVGQ